MEVGTRYHAKHPRTSLHRSSPLNACTVYSLHILIIDYYYYTMLIFVYVICLVSDFKTKTTSKQQMLHHLLSWSSSCFGWDWFVCVPSHSVSLSYMFVYSRLPRPSTIRSHVQKCAAVKKVALSDSIYIQYTSDIHP